MSGFDRRLDPDRTFRRVEIINGAGGRWHWSADDKARILEETLMPGAVVSEVARRHGLRPQQVFGWRREVRIPTKPATYSDQSPARYSDFIPASIPI